MSVRTEWCGLHGGKTAHGSCSGEQLSWFFLGLVGCPDSGISVVKWETSRQMKTSLVTHGFSLRSNTNNNNLLSTTHECEHTTFLCCSIDSLAEGCIDFYFMNEGTEDQLSN